MRHVCLSIAALVLLAASGCPQQYADESPPDRDTVETPPPVGLDVNPGRPQTERPTNP